MQNLINHKGIEETIQFIESQHQVLDKAKTELQNYKAEFEISSQEVDYKSQRLKIEKKIKRLKDLYINELITLEEYKADLNRFNAELDKIPADTIKTDLKAIETLLNMDIESLYYELTHAERQVLIRSVIKQINVDTKNKMELVFN